MKPPFTTPPVITYRGFVSAMHLEPNGQMRLPYQVARCEEASWQLLARIGCSPSALQQQRRGFVALEQRLTHQTALHAAALLHIESELLEIGARSLHCRHRLCDSEAQRVLSTMDLALALVGLDERCVVPWPRELMWRAQTLFPNALVRAVDASPGAAAVPAQPSAASNATASEPGGRLAALPPTSR